MNKPCLSLSFLVAAAIGLCQPAHAQESAPASASTVNGTAYELAREQEQQSVTVTNVDQQSRYVTLRDSKGKEFTIIAGPEVRNLAQLKAGDTVTVTFEAAAALELLPANSASVGVEQEDVGARAPLGAKPGMEAGQSTSVTSRISAIDLKKFTVTLTGPDGKQRVVEVKDPTRRERMKHIKVGDLVRITYVEGVAMQVTPKGHGKP
jgi:Cu/Ag efflux protein CusF